MVRRLASSLLTVLLTGTVWLGRCVSCRTPASQEPVHDCCNQGSCHRDSSEQPAGKQCPHQALALEQYAQADHVAPAAVIGLLPVDVGLELAPGPAHTPVTESRIAHSPPDLYLFHSALLI